MKNLKRLILLGTALFMGNEAISQDQVGRPIEVPLILLTELSSGTEEGKKVAFMVTRDIFALDKSVLIPRGTIAYGTVKWSRSAGAISKFINEPARLAVAIEHAFAVDGSKVALKARKDDQLFHFTGENTGVERASEELAKVLAEEEGKKAIEKMLGGLIGDDMGSDDVVAALAARLNLSGLKQLAEARSLGDLVGVFKGIAVGQVTRIASGHVLTVIDAVSELAGLRRSVGNRISGLFKGRNIRAFPGTPVTAYIIR